MNTQVLNLDFIVIFQALLFVLVYDKSTLVDFKKKKLLIESMMLPDNLLFADRH